MGRAAGITAAAGLAAALAAATLAAPAAGQAAGQAAGPAPGQVDYVVPTPARTAAWQARAVPASGSPVCLGCGVEKVAYTDFDGAVHELWRHPGLHVAVLVPEDRPRYAMSDEELRQFIDLLDLTYEAYAELLHGEPMGDGLLEVAFVPVIFGGHARLAWKGIELDPSLEREIQRLLPDDAVYWVPMHEMGHNFDIYGTRFEYLTDQTHAWTFGWMDQYMPDYMRTGDSASRPAVDPAGYERAPRSPRELLRSNLAGNWRSFAEDPEADWDRCVRLGLCDGWANTTWGAFHLYLSDQLGPQATSRVFAYLARTVRGDTVFHAPLGAEAREEIWLRAWADATQSDVSCYAEALRWHTSDRLRQELQELYGTAAPLCADRDGDGVRTIEGDCNDRDAAIVPGRDEVANGIDDDCDGFVDELSIAEESKKRQRVPFPAQVAASGRQGQKKKFFFRPPGQDPVWVGLASGTRSRGLLWFLGKGESVADGTGDAYAYGKIASRTGKPVGMRYDVRSTGDYELIVAPADPWPVSWATLAEPRITGKRANFVLETDLSQIDEVPTHIRFWVSGTGWVATRKFAPRVKGVWKIPPDAPPGQYGVRAQLLRDGAPLSQFSPMRVFRLDDR